MSGFLPVSARLNAREHHAIAPIGTGRAKIKSQKRDKKYKNSKIVAKSHTTERGFMDATLLTRPFNSILGKGSCFKKAIMLKPKDRIPDDFIEAMRIAAIIRHGKISLPVRCKTDRDAITIEGDTVYYWYNNSDGSTHVIKSPLQDAN